MSDIASHIDAVGGPESITVCDVHCAFWQIPIAKKDCYKTAFVTSKGKYFFKVLLFGIANAPWVFQRVMSLAFASFGQRSGLLAYIYGRCHSVFSNVGDAPQIIRGYVLSTSSSRLDIKASQYLFWTK